MKPLVAIVGRPNVGKSTFFNKISGKRIAIVEDVPGVTRDRLYADAEWCGHNFTLIDTGGIEIENRPFQEQIRSQAEIAIEEADVVVFFVGAVAVEVYLAFSAAVGYGVVEEIAEDGVEHR